MLVCLQDLVDIDKSELLLTLAQILAELTLKVLDPQDIVLDPVCSVDLLSLCKVALELKVKGPLVLLKIDVPAVEVTQLKVSDVVNFQQGFEVLEEIVVVLFLQLLLTEVCNLCQGFEERRLVVWGVLLVVEIDQVHQHWISLVPCESVGLAENLLLIKIEPKIKRVIDESQRDHLEAKLNDAKVNCGQKVAEAFAPLSAKIVKLDPCCLVHFAV